ncbi:serine hydrolase domain-containing protein [Robertkochia sediminum]|uniref:serine hydrolase domain-containing protein n=1 Tax=Robertkochia sediminum TaxID=2785326 RepID=UPI001934A467|nr:serine hydrolase [Robertkochia sediminum]MBL7473788.1 serine hydrolase [Robertkochia sediminum]
MKRIIKLFLYALISIVIVGLIYSLIPRVFNGGNTYGNGLPKSDYLKDKIENEINRYIQDSSSRIETVVCLKEGEIVYEFGDTKKLINTRSIRKSIMNLLYGIAVDKGVLNINETLESLGIDESQTPLTEQEKTATIRDLLMARSGVYLPAEGEVATTRDNRPNRDQYKPGEYFLYNNFDFNVLGAILEKKTNMSIGEFMEEYLAKPLQLQDFSSSNIVYDNPWPIPNKSMSDYPIYWIFMSTRDLAKVGLLVSQKGNWNGEQIVPAEWINESTQPYTKYEDYDINQNPIDAYGYLWKIDTDNNNIWADGYGGQYLIIDTENNLVTTQLNPNGNSLLSSGLYLMDENRDNASRIEIMNIHNMILEN